MLSPEKYESNDRYNAEEQTYSASNNSGGIQTKVTFNN